jgi:hypothetical protein
MSSTETVKTSVRDRYVVFHKAAQDFCGGEQNVGVFVVKYHPQDESCVESA